jgi:hypothetical protein
MTFGDIKIFISINLNELIIIFRRLGIEADWLSRSETTKISLTSKNSVFTFKNRAIECKLNDKIIHVGGGLIFRILFSHLLPSSIAKFMMNGLLQLENTENLEKLVSASKEDYSSPSFVQEINLKVDPYS